ncbi:excinuclease ABC subunit UvrA [bacterium endosymbiont of Bathymodiolus sp. 5 South]|jgi:excinuclease ABC subunit A|uniref:excinuclease ABC subunit UvrA n=1 Tax=bacterium endosymbiont of Bathymodiolus sp. 5 South TaxID=1181670 RepID=UPI0010B3C192|nr:excinuclease ABC subunit UvrA [bacterium endosymbiont of Bathymodiolus sp. 5 South]CAC9640897.1 Excinuclease ABC subunit A [uncultured Gammaproteobacteria bacterium]CAC9643134.1 Excinuclease ABC subunit A [uncultured Gammaproteobacteria bacterium]CAC9655376.1 Excinuclease ABC subunit A [uncultured Gammaproteobacteria bacterium]SHN90615.1 Excinuclease ABC subunit A [bacterium endosymbiont of Bathymodiolus sp. 5 South]VVH55273.1 Excinuclease ABC subunit A [uncultured Gammaproteobacteria bacte
MEKISIQGARVHNLKNIDIDIPRNKLVVITGLSGSGKSSLAFDTIYAEGQRRYVESLSAYARQFLSLMEKPDVDHIEGLSPAISIEQKATSHNPRSTVGTITEIYDYLRLLFARVGVPKCPTHKIDLVSQTVSQMVDSILTLPESEKIMILAPVVQNRKGSHTKMLDELSNQGFLRARVDGKVIYLDELDELNGKTRHTIEIVVDRLKVRKEASLRLSESLETALNLSAGLVRIASMDEASKQEELVFSAKFSCVECGYSLTELEPRLFSFNNPVGACQSCDGLGVQDVFDENKVVSNPEASLANGAIYGWGRSNAYFYQILTLVGQYYGFSVDTPYQALSAEHKKIVLYGSGKDTIDFSKIKGRNGWSNKPKPFEGVIPRMMHRYEESEIRSVREELSRYVVSKNCKSCDGSRLNESARNVFITDYNLSNITKLSIANSYKFFKDLKLEGVRGEIAQKILREIIQRLEFLLNVGLEYLSLERRSGTLSGGEAQRIRLASQIGAGLMGVLYVLDEPSIGLHQRDNQKLLNTLIYLRDIGNTVIVVEHDEDAIKQADFVIDIGPGAGVHGGEIIAVGTPQQIADNPQSITGDYISGRQSIAVPKKRKKATQWLRIKGATGNNLNKVDLSIPVGVLTCVTGVSGSGKSTLINDTLYSLVARDLNRSQVVPAPYESIKGLNHFDKVVNIDQSPIGRTPRSNPATYTGVFSLIRDLFAQTLESRSRGYKAGRFSFNVKGGRCEACKGDGLIKVEMHFLADIYVSCDVCDGRRYNRETLEVFYKGKTIAQVLAMTVEAAVEFFEAIPKIKQKLQTLMDVGLSYITLGQNATTLSGGEAQRIKLAKELSKLDTGNTLYILDEPTTGLHFHDIKQLLSVINRLRERENTIVIIEHNLDVIKTADWIVDLGPEGGDKGGDIIAVGTPEEIAQVKKSYTGQYLQPLLEP